MAEKVYLDQTKLLQHIDQYMLMKEKNYGNPTITLDEAVMLVTDILAANVVEVRHGEWIEEEKEVEFYGCIDKQTFYKCSLCGRYEEKDEPYCHCGAKMDGKGDNNE